MEYPILPGSVIPNDEHYSGQRIQRPNAIERQVHYVDRIPAQRVDRYNATQDDSVYVRSMQPPIIVQHAPAYANPTVLPSTYARRERCCSTRLTIVLSVLIICVFIGTGIGVGMYFKYGRGDSKHSNLKSGEGGSSQTKCILTANDVINFSLKDDDDDDKHDDDDDDDESKDTSKQKNLEIAGKHKYVGDDDDDGDDIEDKNTDKGNKHGSSDKNKGCWIKDKETKKIKWHSNSQDFKDLPYCD
uniref:uncharacterized protein LOC120326179 isoform X1 n=1 Tax=Styela clava TaxID=7725 RepID=UPI001939450C|nr:uncharacterized protein LOC120326179 isoform X1 [Styela clava]